MNIGDIMVSETVAVHYWFKVGSMASLVHIDVDNRLYIPIHGFLEPPRIHPLSALDTNVLIAEDMNQGDSAVIVGVVKESHSTKNECIENATEHEIIVWDCYAMKSTENMLEKIALCRSTKVQADE